jgi:hypothetical protein
MTGSAPRRRLSVTRTRNWGLGICLVPTWHVSNPRALAYAVSAQVGPVIVGLTVWRRSIGQETAE